MTSGLPPDAAVRRRAGTLVAAGGRVWLSLPVWRGLRGHGAPVGGAGGAVRRVGRRSRHGAERASRRESPPRRATVSHGRDKAPRGDAPWARRPRTNAGRRQCSPAAGRASRRRSPSAPAPATTSPIAASVGQAGVEVVGVPLGGSTGSPVHRRRRRRCAAEPAQPGDRVGRGGGVEHLRRLQARRVARHARAAQQHHGVGGEPPGRVGRLVDHDRAVAVRDHRGARPAGSRSPPRAAATARRGAASSAGPPAPGGGPARGIAGQARRRAVAQPDHASRPVEPPVRRPAPRHATRGRRRQGGRGRPPRRVADAGDEQRPRASAVSRSPSASTTRSPARSSSCSWTRAARRPPRPRIRASRLTAASGTARRGRRRAVASRCARSGAAARLPRGPAAQAGTPSTTPPRRRGAEARARCRRPAGRPTDGDLGGSASAAAGSGRPCLGRRVAEHAAACNASAARRSRARRHSATATSATGRPPRPPRPRRQPPRPPRRRPARAGTRPPAQRAGRRAPAPSPAAAASRSLAPSEAADAPADGRARRRRRSASAAAAPAAAGPDQQSADRAPARRPPAARASAAAGPRAWRKQRHAPRQPRTSQAGDGGQPGGDRREPAPSSRGGRAGELRRRSARGRRPRGRRACRPARASGRERARQARPRAVAVAPAAQPSSPAEGRGERRRRPAAAIRPASSASSAASAPQLGGERRPPRRAGRRGRSGTGAHRSPRRRPGPGWTGGDGR